MALPGPHTRPATSALQRMTIRPSSGTSSRCLGPLRTLSWPTQLKERSTMCSGPQLSLTGSLSAITTAWRSSVCSAGVPHRLGRGCVFQPLPPSFPRKKNVSSGQYVYCCFTPTVFRSCCRSPGQLPRYLCWTVLCGTTAAQGWVLNFHSFPLLCFLIKRFCIFVCQVLCS